PAVASKASFWDTDVLCAWAMASQGDATPSTVVDLRIDLDFSTTTLVTLHTRYVRGPPRLGNAIPVKDLLTQAETKDYME
ncbi:MAG: hypothetical protein HN491_05180, partial [Rhodospirillales bacterium]|nr:hypothetical protein [Rhodospirillales bacterium]